HIGQTIEATALHDRLYANWPQSVGVPRPGRTALLVQHCHGAPGIVNCLADFPDSGIDDLLTAAGGLTWTAGPLRKGPNLCHGTAGNGLDLCAKVQTYVTARQATALRFSSCFGEPRIRVGSIVHERLLCMRWLRVSATRRPMVNTATPCGQEILVSHCTCGVVFMPRLGFQRWTFSDESVRVAFGTTGCLSWLNWV